MAQAARNWSFPRILMVLFFVTGVALVLFLIDSILDFSIALNQGEIILRFFEENLLIPHPLKLTWVGFAVMIPYIVWSQRGKRFTLALRSIPVVVALLLLLVTMVISYQSYRYEKDRSAFSRDVGRADDLRRAGDEVTSYLIRNNTNNMPTLEEFNTFFIERSTSFINYKNSKNSSAGRSGVYTNPVLLDRQTLALYEYEKLSNTSFNICAQFETNNQKILARRERACVTHHISDKIVFDDAAVSQLQTQAVVGLNGRRLLCWGEICRTPWFPDIVRYD